MDERQGCFLRLDVSHLSYRRITKINKTATNASSAASSLASTIVPFAIFGCPIKINPIIVPNVYFAVWEVPRTFNTATPVACALTSRFTTSTIARAASTRPIVQFVKSFSLAVVRHHTKCPVDTRFIGIVSVNWRHMIRAVPFAKRRRKRENECSPHGIPWRLESPCNPSHRIYVVLYI